MALFGRKTKKEEKKDVASAKEVKSAVAATPSLDRDLSAVIVRPMVTEKAVQLGEKNVYVFEVRKGSTKHEIRDAVKTLWKVTPTKVNIVERKPREFVSRMRGRRGTHPGLRKAYVYLKAGERIELV